jgi:hypothetical protein
LLLSSNVLYGATFSGGAVAAGTVFFLITNVVRNLDSTVMLYFVGGPNSTNVIPSTTSLTTPVVWQNLSTNATDANGAWQFTDGNNTATRFFRSYAK